MVFKEPKYEFSPPVSQWDTDHLIFIANDETLFWEKDAIRQAREELTKRNVAPEYEQTVLRDGDKENHFGERLLELGEKKTEANALEKYTLEEKITILVCAPFILLHGIGLFDIGDSLSVLKGLGYKTKYRARLRLLIMGVALWATLIILSGAIGRYYEK